MSKIRFLKISSGYTGHIGSFYRQRPGLSVKSYAIQQREFFDDCFSWADFWKINLDKTEKFIAEEIVFNNEVMQRKWAEENQYNYTYENWEKEILLEQIKEFKPDVLFITDIYHYAEWYKSIKQLVPSIRLVIGWDGILWHKEETFASCDVVLSCVEDTVEFYKVKGKNSWFFPFGFEKTILSRLKKSNTQFGLSFVGSVVLIKGYHFGRLNILYELSKKLPVNYWISNFIEGWKITDKPQISRMLNGKFDEMKKVHRLGRINRGQLYGLDMYNAFYNSKFVLNTHGDNSAVKAANFRLTEATGAGSCLVTDWKDNISDYFIPDEEVITYRSTAEAIDKVKYLMANEPERKKIAEAGHKKTISQYSFEKRVLDFVPYLYSLL